MTSFPESPKTSRSSRPMRTLSILATVLLLLGLIAACGQESTDAGSGGGGSTLTAAGNSLGTMQWAPATSGEDTEKIAVGMYDNLIKLDPQTRTLKPLLAESYEVSPDGRTWTFKLRPNVKFHGDWGTVTSEDVKYTWSQWIADNANHNTTPILTDAVGG